MNYFKDKNNEIFAYDNEQVKQGYGKNLIPITEEELAELLKPTLKQAKKQKISEINGKCKQEIEAGVASSALGSEHIYQSEPVDQINLMGVVLAGQDSLFKCGVKDDKGNITWSYKQHTIAQLQQVLQDGKVHKQGLLQKANTLKTQVANATTVKDVEAIVW